VYAPVATAVVSLRSDLRRMTAKGTNRKNSMIEEFKMLNTNTSYVVVVTQQRLHITQQRWECRRNQFESGEGRGGHVRPGQSAKKIVVPSAVFG